MSETPVPHGTANGAADSAPVLPPLYRALEGITAERHSKLRLRDAGFGFAAGASAVPLAAEEFVVAARSLPIVFTAQPPHMPVVITGLAAGTNLYVDSGGAWRIGAYVPAYLRRFPFFLLRMDPDSEDLALCIDPSAPQVSESQGEPLFAPDGKPSPQLERAFAFTRSVEEAMMRTRSMALRFAELGLLKASVVEFQHLGRPIRVDGFFAVDRPALATLGPEELTELRDRGWLEVIYAHLLSVGGMRELAREIQV